MMLQIGTECVNQDVYVWEIHPFSSSTKSAKAALLLISTPGFKPPLRAETGNALTGDFERFPPVNTVNKPSSIKDVSERPSRAAFRLARINSSSFNLMVVLILALTLHW